MLPEADKLPQNLKYLGLCVLYRRRFWRDPRRIRAELEKEARSEMYMQNTLAMLAARIELIDAYLSGETTVDTEPAPALDSIAQVAGSAIQVAPEQAVIINTIGQRVQQAQDRRCCGRARSKAAIDRSGDRLCECTSR